MGPIYNAVINISLNKILFALSIETKFLSFKIQRLLTVEKNNININQRRIKCGSIYFSRIFHASLTWLKNSMKQKNYLNIPKKLDLFFKFSQTLNL